MVNKPSSLEGNWNIEYIVRRDMSHYKCKTALLEIAWSIEQNVLLNPT